MNDEKKESVQYSLSIHKDIKFKLKSFIKNNRIPNIIFHGPHGSGKKTILNEFLNNIYNNQIEIYNNFVLTVNCAHGKGIKFIREDLKFFAKTNILLPGTSYFKSVVLLNADKLTIDAQSALRRCIEQFSYSTRFFIIVVDKYKLLRPILSRFCEIYIAEPLIRKKPTNLHIYDLNKCYPVQKTYQVKSKKLSTRLKNISVELKNILVFNEKLDALKTVCECLYYDSYSVLDLMRHVETASLSELEYLPNFDEIRKYDVLLFIQKVKREFRDEKLLFYVILYFVLVRFDYPLENISFM
jgi:DNA polymerase III delta prime subunit